MIKTISINEIPAINKGQVSQDIEDFMNSESEACEVFGSETRSVNSLHACYYQAVKNKNYPVDVIRRKNRVFLVKKSAM